MKTFWLEPTALDQRSLRRYASGSTVGPCPVHGYHNALVHIGSVSRVDEPHVSLTADLARELDDRWPVKCDCGYEFRVDDEWQDFRRRLYRRSDTGELTTIQDAPPGASWDATWYHDLPTYRGPDGRSIMVKCPDGHEWCIDSRASNCTMPSDDVHKCWVRHGTPEKCDLTVDKNGFTCNAGAGSIATPGYHGFLRNGEFTPA